MAQTFEIRFARSDGIAALFDSAENSFGWKGGGLLRIDSLGMSFALKRGVASLLSRHRSRRIPAERITEVYREGEALRVEFVSEENPRAVLPFWARDRDTAAQIVQLLPTSRTIELEQTTGPPQQRRSRRTPLAVGVILLMVGGALVLLMRQAPDVDNMATRPPIEVEPVVKAMPAEPTTQGSAATAPSPVVWTDEPITPEEARKLAMLAEEPIDWTKPPPKSSTAGTAAVQRSARFDRMTETLPAAEPVLPTAEPDVEAFVPMEVPEIELRPDQVVVGIPQTTLAYGSARELLNAFEAKVSELTGSYRGERERFDRGTLDTRTFANRLDALEMRWRGLGEGMLATRKYDDPALTGLRGTLAIVVIQQRVFLTGYAEGLRTDDKPRVERAFAELARAEEAMARARLYVN